MRNIGLLFCYERVTFYFRFIARFSCCELQHYSFLSLSYNRSYVDENLSPSLVVARKTPDFNRIIGDFAILLTFYSAGQLSQHAGFSCCGYSSFILYWFL